MNSDMQREETNDISTQQVQQQQQYEEQDDDEIRSNSTFDSTSDMNESNDTNEENTKMVDMTILEEENEPVNYDGGVDEEDEHDYNFAEKVALRKNLSETFDKHVTEQPNVTVVAAADAIKGGNKKQNNGG